ALTSRQHALLAGERHPALIWRVARDLCSRQRWVEADQTVRLLPESPPAGSLARLTAEIAVRIGDQRRGLELARAAVPPSSVDHTDRVWLAQVLGAVGQNEEAEKLLRRATQDTATIPDVWIALVQHLNKTK